MDYSLTSSTVTFTAGATDGELMMFQVIVNADVFFEADQEDMVFDLLDPGNPNINVTSSSATVEIIDQDGISNLISMHDSVHADEGSDNYSQMFSVTL